MNFFEKWILKRLVKKLVKKLPDLKERAKQEGQEVIEKLTDAIEKYKEDFFNKIEITIAKFIEECENKSK